MRPPVNAEPWLECRAPIGPDRRGTAFHVVSAARDGGGQAVANLATLLRELIDRLTDTSAGVLKVRGGALAHASGGTGELLANL